MAKFLCLQRSLPQGDSHQPKPSSSSSPTPSEELPKEEQMKAMYAKFNAWREKYQKNLSDMGGKLGAGKLVATEIRSDGPFVEVKELVGGYMIVTASNLDEAIEIAKACPGLVRPGSGVEVIEIHTPGA